MTGSSALADITPPRRPVPLALIGVGVGGVAGALVGQHVFGLEPCVLCLWQRVPYAAVAVLGALALFVPGDRTPCLMVGAAAGVFLVGAAIAFYHVGVEEHWWESAVPGCDPETVSFLNDRMTPEELQAALAAKPPKPCDEVDWRLFGLSLAGLNTIGSLALAATTFAGLRRMAQGEPA